MAEPLWKLLGVLFKPHPWHGISPGPQSPDVVTCYIEIVPTDTVKYEVDKTTGYLTIDRPQRFSNVCPALYGFVPQTYCADQVAALSIEKTGRPDIEGDGDPLDICVLTEKNIAHGDLVLKAVPIGGFRMLDGDEADDKIIAVLKDDLLYGKCRGIEDCPPAVLSRLKHYFLTYKRSPDANESPCEITHVYGREEAHDVIHRAQLDYQTSFGNLEDLLTAALRG